MFRSPPQSRDAACCWQISQHLTPRSLGSDFLHIRFIRSLSTTAHPIFLSFSLSLVLSFSLVLSLSHTHSLSYAVVSPLWCVYLQCDKHSFKVPYHRLIISKVMLVEWAALFLSRLLPNPGFLIACLASEVFNIFGQSWVGIKAFKKDLKKRQIGPTLLYKCLSQNTGAQIRSGLEHRHSLLKSLKKVWNDKDFKRNRSNVSNPVSRE